MPEQPHLHPQLDPLGREHFLELSRTSRQACTRDKAYLALVITIVPLWALLTTLVVYLLLTCHRNLRATKIYDNCTKSSAQHSYLLELRTGDISAAYNPRKTTLTVDMFDDNQNTLSRIAIPGHVIFGRKETPTQPSDDEKFSDLRVVKFWLYRASRLKRVATIRLTHTCADPDAKIMVYALQIRSADPERQRTFFPVMSYISAYGSSTRPNACFDADYQGNISSMGGDSNDNCSVSERLESVDYVVLLILFGGILILLTSHDLLEDSNEDSVKATYKGLMVGAIAFLVSFLVGLGVRYCVRYQYVMQLGTGIWAVVYHATNASIALIGVGLWILTAVSSYQDFCSDEYGTWLLSICMALVVAVVMTMIASLIYWLSSSLNPKQQEQYVVPDEITPDLTATTKVRTYGSRGYLGAVDPGQAQQNLMANQISWQPQMVGPVQMGVMPGYSPTSPMTVPMGRQTSSPPGFASYNLAGPQPINSPIGSPSGHGYKTAHMYHQAYSPDQQAGGLAHPTAKTTAITYGQSSSPPNQPNQSNQQGNKLRRTGSNESTGSNYYQQLMKNKGGVKSISQYGELLRKQRKASTGKGR